jgi:hypothetical protein
MANRKTSAVKLTNETRVTGYFNVYDPIEKFGFGYITGLQQYFLHFFPHKSPIALRAYRDDLNLIRGLSNKWIDTKN